jgi:hypothetical protein
VVVVVESVVDSVAKFKGSLGKGNSILNFHKTILKKCRREACRSLPSLQVSFQFKRLGLLRGKRTLAESLVTGIICLKDAD